MGLIESLAHMAALVAVGTFAVLWADVRVQLEKSKHELDDLGNAFSAAVSREGAIRARLNKQTVRLEALRDRANSCATPAIVLDSIAGLLRPPPRSSAPESYTTGTTGAVGGAKGPRRRR